MPHWIKATKDDLKDMGSKHWQDGENKTPISVGTAFLWIKNGFRSVEWLCEDTPDKEVADKDKRIKELEEGLRSIAEYANAGKTITTVDSHVASMAKQLLNL